MGSLRRWLKARLGGQSLPASSGPELINLLEETPAPAAPPQQIGIDPTLQPRPWSVARLAAIFRDAQRSPSAAALQAGRHARHCLSAFWLAAPADQLNVLYSGAIGDLQRLLLEGPLPQQPLAADELEWRTALLSRVASADQGMQKINLLLALMPYAPPRTITVEDPLVSVPRWLLPDYITFCQPELKHQLEGPAGLLKPVPDPRTSGATLPLLTDRRGEAAMEWFSNEEALARMQALLNLYGLDPNDAQTLRELGLLRSVVAQLWLDVDPSQVEELYRTPVGLLTRSLHTAGFGKVVLNDLDRQVRRVLGPQVADCRDPNTVKVLLALLPFTPPGGISVVQVDGIPAWLQQELSLL